MPYTFLCKHTFIFSMANQSFLKVKWTNRYRCILCSQIMKNDEKWKDVTEEGIQALKDLAERWKSLDVRVCLQPHYN